MMVSGVLVHVVQNPSDPDRAILPRASPGNKRHMEAIKPFFPPLLLNALRDVYDTGENQCHRPWCCSKRGDSGYSKSEYHGCAGLVLALCHQTRWGCSLPAPKSNAEMVAFCRIGELSKSGLEKEMESTDTH